MQDQLIDFYTGLTRDERYPEWRTTFESLVRENMKEKETIDRAYREAITDVLEVGLSSSGLNPEDYEADLEHDESLGISDSVRKAVVGEESVRRFCEDVGKSRFLISDISRAFEQVGKRKLKRQEALESILKKTT
jgi:hypothetical protein